VSVDEGYRQTWLRVRLVYSIRYIFYSVFYGTRIEVVCEGASQGGGPGRPITEAHNHDMINTGTEKSDCVVKHQ